ncbi:MAG: alpha/beta fold hydrolase [Parasphingopyxis sp.]|uniref:alpha/beta fold hydrolase n=1 Tax=Parasphingopyxis sp. TaxID=1920299 RepID=UPI003FA0F243
MAGLERDGKQLYFEDRPGDGRPVLLIHGWSASLRVWDTVSDALVRAGNRVIAFDQRGCGESDKDFGSATLEESIGDTIALIDHLALENVVVNGWSLGGAVALGSAVRNDKVSGLVLTCGAAPRYTRADDFPYGGTEADVHAVVEALRKDRPGTFREMATAVCSAEISNGVEEWIWQLFLKSTPLANRAILDLAQSDQRSELGALAVPVLSVTGGRDNFVVPAIGLEAARIAPHGTHVSFDHCGHAPFLEDFDGYMTALSRFLKDLDG